MKKLLLALFAAAVVLAVALPGTAGTREMSYEIEVFDPPGSVWTSLRDINQRGEIVGFYYESPTEVHAFTYFNGAYKTVTVPDAVYTFVEGNNDHGTVVGWTVNADGSQPGFALDRQGNLTVVNVPGAAWTEVHDVNNAGTMVGFYLDASGLHGFIYADGVYTYPIDVPPSDPALPPGATWLMGINNQGQIAGTVTDYASYSLAFVMAPDGSVTWVEPTVPGAPQVGRGLFDINEHGQAVGTVISDGAYTGWLWDGGEDVFFSNIPDTFRSWIYGINDRGDMVGVFQDSTGMQHGMLIGK